MLVGKALQAGREWAMNQAQTNKPEGKAYNMAFGEWLQRYKMNDLNSGDRTRLFQLVGALSMVEDWRATLTLTERLTLNHPSTVWRRFKAATEIPKPKPAKPSLRDSVTELSEENVRLKAPVDELEAATGTLSNPSSDAARDPVTEPSEETARLKARIAELEAASGPTADTDRGAPATLYWIASPFVSGKNRSRRLRAATGAGVYDIVPCFTVRSRSMPSIFNGFDVRFVTIRNHDEGSGDDPDSAPTEDIRIVGEAATTEAEAKRFAEADFRGER